MVELFTDARVVFMNGFIKLSWIAVALCTCVNANAQFSESQIRPSNFTTLVPVPQGCLSIWPSVRAIPEDESLFFNQEVQISQDGKAGSFQVRVWRIGCHEPDRSAIAVNFKHVGGSKDIRYPSSHLVDGDGERISAPMLAGAQQGEMASFDSTIPSLQFEEGPIFILNTDELPAFYNDHLILELDWGSGQTLQIPVFFYDPDVDSPQFAEPRLHGRYTGQWTSAELPRSGLVLQIGEVQPDRNFVFAIWFTYLEGEPIWVVGNADFEVDSNAVDIEMLRLEGGGFVTAPGTFMPGDVDAEIIGTMTIEANHCNSINVDMDFSSSGLGTQTLELGRLIRIAGYDCDQTQ